LRDDAQAAMWRGDLERVEELSAKDVSPHGVLVRGLAAEGRGRFDLAVQTLTPLRDAAKKTPFTTAPDVTAAAQGIGEMAVLEGRAGERDLTQKDRASAQVALGPALKIYPTNRTLLAAAAAVAALKYDQAATDVALKKFDEVSPGHPLGLFITGKYQSMGRQ